MTEFDRNRPLGPVSDFVVERMPMELERVRAGQLPVAEFADRIHTLV